MNFKNQIPQCFALVSEQIKEARRHLTFSQDMELTAVKMMSNKILLDIKNKKDISEEESKDIAFLLNLMVDVKRFKPVHSFELPPVSNDLTVLEFLVVMGIRQSMYSKERHVIAQMFSIKFPQIHPWNEEGKEWGSKFERKLTEVANLTEEASGKLLHIVCPYDPVDKKSGMIYSAGYLNFNLKY